MKKLNLRDLHYVNLFHRPWGYYANIRETADNTAKTKVLVVKPEARLSLQMHFHRSEVWTVLSGTGVAEIGGVEIPLAPMDNIEIPAGTFHRLCNKSQWEELVVLEFQHGPKCVEEDIVRTEDDYGRIKKTESNI